MYGPKWPFLLRYGFRDTRRIDFPQVDGLSTDTPILGRHSKTRENSNFRKNGKMVISIKIQNFL